MSLICKRPFAQGLRDSPAARPATGGTGFTLLEQRVVIVLSAMLTGALLATSSGLHAFIDRQERSIGFGDLDWPHQDGGAWGGLPADRHADSHTEQWRWRWLKRDRPCGDRVKNKAEVEDFKFMIAGRLRERDYMPAWWSWIQ